MTRRRWEWPTGPGPDVTAVQGARTGLTWRRGPRVWTQTDDRRHRPWAAWTELLHAERELTDATPPALNDYEQEH